MTVALYLTPLDLWISSWFFDHETLSWNWFYSTWCTAFYRGGIYPAFALAVLGIVLTAVGLISRPRRDRLRSGLFLLLVFAIGPGFVVNYALKQHWGRPRPHQVAEFGGPHGFTPVGVPGTLTSHNSSFPSGHAAVAFYLIAPAFLVRERRPRTANTLLAAGLFFGTGMSATRIVQGGHFTSDVIWSAGIVYVTCVLCARLILRPRIPAPTERAMAQSIRLRQAA